MRQRRMGGQGATVSLNGSGRTRERRSRRATRRECQDRARARAPDFASFLARARDRPVGLTFDAAVLEALVGAAREALLDRHVAGRVFEAREKPLRGIEHAARVRPACGYRIARLLARRAGLELMRRGLDDDDGNDVNDDSRRWRDVGRRGGLGSGEPGVMTPTREARTGVAASGGGRRRGDHGQRGCREEGERERRLHTCLRVRMDVG
jgi:hypothetical protein